MKKTFILFLAIILLGTNTTAASFSDVSKDHHLYQYVNWFEEQGVVQGYQDGTFKPDNEVNRAEFLKMLYETIGMQEKNVSLPFNDVPENEWYTKYVKEAYSTGIVVGYSDGSFRPENPINFAEALKIVMNGFFDVNNLYADGTNYDKCSGIALDTYSSVSNTSWYWKYIHVADELCILSFDSNAHVWKHLGGDPVASLMDYNPGAYVTRADMAALLYISKAVKDNGTKKFNSFTMVPTDIINEENLSSAQQSAKNKCEELNGSSSLALSELYGEQQIFCSFGGGECTQGELNENACFMETNQSYKSANEKCANLGGNSYLSFSELYGEDQVFCSFGSEGECTQNELNDGECFKE